MPKMDLLEGEETSNGGTGTGNNASVSDKLEPPSPAVISVRTTTDVPLTPKKVRFFVEDDGERPSTSKAAFPSFEHIRITTDIGIYLDETSVLVGRFNSDINDVEILKHYSAEIAFENGNILIGLEAEKYRQSRNHFYVNSLLKLRSSSSHTIEFQTGRHSISTKSIHSTFFKQLGKEIMEITQTVSLGNVCLTVPFTTSSLDRKRLKTALADAGFLNPRVISSLLSTALAFTKDSSYYLNNVRQRKLIFVAQCLKTSFSMAIVEISPEMVTTRSCFGSNNMPECRDGIFTSLNEKLFNNHSLDEGKQEFMLKVYQKAVDQLYSNISKEIKLSGVFIVKASQKSTKLDCLFRDIFGENVTTAPDIARGPLLGAALLASKNNLSVPLLRSSLDVYDSGRTNLVYSLGNHKSRVITQNQCFLPREVFRTEVIVPLGGTTLVLSEEYSEDGFAVEVHKVSVPQPFQWRKNKAFTIILHVAIDENGIYSVNVFPLQKFLKSYR